MQPRVDLYPYTGSLPAYGFPAIDRGDLYVNDVFRNDPAWAGNPVLSEKVAEVRRGKTGAGG